MIKIAISVKAGWVKPHFQAHWRVFLQDGDTMVLAIDADPSMNLASALGIKNPPRPLTEYKD